MTPAVRRQLVLAGRVLADGVPARPLAGARVELVSVPARFSRWLAAHAVQHGAAWDALDERPDRTRTDVAGRFSFIDLPSGSYGLVASLPDGGSRYGSKKAKAKVARNAAGDAQLTVVELRLPTTAISGTIVDADARPVPFASVLIADGSGRAYTDAQGRFALCEIEAGRRSLVVRAKGFEEAEHVADLPRAGATRTLNVALRSAAN